MWPRQTTYNIMHTIPKAPEGLSCPSCGAQKIAVILYGLPAVTEEFESALADKTVTLGGCLIYDGAPQRVCNVCSCTFGEVRIHESE